MYSYDDFLIDILILTIPHVTMSSTIIHLTTLIYYVNICDCSFFNHYYHYGGTPTSYSNIILQTV